MHRSKEHVLGQGVYMKDNDLIFPPSPTKGLEL